MALPKFPKIRFTGFLTPRLAWLPVAGSFMLLIVFLFLLSPSADEQEKEVKIPEFVTIQAEARDVQLELDSQGMATARRRVSLTMETGGQIIELAPEFRNGGWAEEGMPLVQLDPEPFALEVTQHRHQLQAAKLHLDHTKANASVARRLADRQATDFALHKPQLAEAQARVDAALSALRMAERRMELATLRAPFSGRLEKVSLTAGQYIAAGQVLGTLFSSDQMEVRLPIQDSWLRLLDLPSQEVAQDLNIPVRLQGSFGGQSHVWAGVIRRREGGLNANQMTWLIADIAVKPGEFSLEPGVYVAASIKGRKLTNVMVLPRTALINDQSVWVITNEQMLQRKKVEWLYRDNEFVYVSKGLQPGEQVLRQGHGHLLEGTPARPVPVTPKEKPETSTHKIVAQHAEPQS